MYRSLVSGLFLSRAGSPSTNFRKKNGAGFTLIELLVVVSIIAILSFTVVTNLSSARAKARDAKRTSDISEIDKAIALYQANGNTTPAMPATKGAQGFTDLLAATGPLKTNNYLPTAANVVDPTATQSYEYMGTTVGGQFNYALCAKLEVPADSTKPWFVDQNGATFTAATDVGFCS